MAGKRYLNPATIARPPGYTHVVEVTGPGRTVYISGQLGLLADGAMAGGGSDFRAQAVQAFENLKSALAAVGATFDDVVKITSYVTDVAAHTPIFREVRDRYVNAKAPPASTLVGVNGLARPDALFEIEAIAALPQH